MPCRARFARCPPQARSLPPRELAGAGNDSRADRGYPPFRLVIRRTFLIMYNRRAFRVGLTGRSGGQQFCARPGTSPLPRGRA